MIILKESQDKIISVLLSMAAVVQRRLEMPIFRIVERRTAKLICHNALLHQTSLTLLTCVAKRNASKAAISNLRLSGFFCVTKANLRNAP